MSLLRVSGLLLGATFVTAVTGQGCTCDPVPTPDAGPGDGPALAFVGLPETVDCDDDVNEVAPGVQLDVTVRINDDDGTGYDEVTVASDQEQAGSSGTASFDDDGEATVTITVAGGAAPGQANVVTATATNADGDTLSTEATVTVDCEDAPVPPSCQFATPIDGDTLTASPTPVEVQCFGGDPDDAEQQALLTSGVVVVTATPGNGGAPESAQLQLAGGVANGDLDLPLDDTATLSLDLTGAAAVFGAPVTDEISVVLDLGVTVDTIVVDAAGADNVLNVADNGGAEAVGTVTSDVTVTFLDSVAGLVVTGTVLTETCPGTVDATGFIVTLAGCTFPQGASSLVVSAADGAGTAVAVGNDTLTLTVDTVSPEATIVEPAEGELLTGADDLEAGAAGLQTDVAITTSADVTDVSLTIDGEADAATGTATAGAAVVRATLPEGDVEIVATVTDAAGNTGASAPRAVVVDSVGPALVLVAPDAIDAGDDVDLLTFGVQLDVTVTPTGLPAGLPIVVSSDIEGVINEGACDSDGDGVAVQCRVTLVDDNTHVLTATAVDENGNPGASNTESVVADTGLVGVRIDNPPLRNGVRVIGVAQDTTPGGAAQVEVTGTTQPNLDLSLFVDGALVNLVPVSSDGAGSFTIPATFADNDSGTIEVRVAELGTQGGSGEDDYLVDLGPPTTSFVDPAGATVVFSQADDASPAPGLQTTVEVAVTECESGVLQILDGTTVIGEAAAPANGNAQLAVDVSDLTDGDSTWTADCTDAVGNTAEAPDTVDVTVDVSGPDGADIDVTVVSIRLGQVTLTFDEPGDGAGGDVATLEVIASREAITLEDFDELAVPFTAGGGGLLDDTIEGAGTPRVLEVDGLAFDNTWNFAVRATDAGGNATLSLAQLPITDFDTTRSTSTHAEADVGDGAGIADGFGGVATGTGDLDGDGANEIVVTAFNQGDDCVDASFCEGVLHIYRGGGDLAAAPAVTLRGDEPGGNFGISAALADLDGDGFSDLIATSYDSLFTESRIHIYYGTGDATLVGTPVTLTSPFTVAFAPEVDVVLPVGDVDGDGTEDLIALSPFATEAVLIRGQGAQLVDGELFATAQTTRITLGASDATQFHATAARLGPLDADAFDDFVLSTDAATNNQLWVVSGRDPGAWGDTLAIDAGGAAIPCPATSCGVFNISGGDVNGDDIADLVATQAGTFNVHLGTATGLPAVRTYAIGASGLSLPTAGQGGLGVIGDVNGDGFDDIAGARGVGGGVVSVYLGDEGVVNRSAADIDYPFAFAAPAAAVVAVCGNFDGDADGLAEICAATNAGDGSVVVQR